MEMPYSAAQNCLHQQSRRIIRRQIRVYEHSRLIGPRKRPQVVVSRRMGYHLVKTELKQILTLKDRDLDVPLVIHVRNVKSLGIGSPVCHDQQ